MEEIALGQGSVEAVIGEDTLEFAQRLGLIEMFEDVRAHGHTDRLICHVDLFDLDNEFGNCGIEISCAIAFDMRTKQRLDHFFMCPMEQAPTCKKRLIFIPFEPQRQLAVPRGRLASRVLRLRSY